MNEEYQSACDKYRVETIKHVLTECPAINELSSELERNDKELMLQRSLSTLEGL